MTNFLGESELAMDSKGRFLLPAKISRQIPEGMGDKFVMNRGFEKCINIYTIDVWNVIYEKVSKLNDFKEEVRKFKRLFLNGASIVELDSTGRILVAKPLMEYAGITKDAVVTAQGNKMELWDKDTYYKYLDQNSGGFSQLAESVANDFGNPFDSL
ncbi:MAG: division/cell wall cluster transcriptional repressor MraZ [Taibaiella sp.]|nr:division/cell wall cluster transcriptional repressor MraZ [Taibaiella sp.]